MTRGGDAFDRGWQRGWTIEAPLTVSEWADRYRVLTKKASAEDGPWSTDRTPYLREIMDRLSVDDAMRRIAFMKGTQLGGTEALNNFLGYIIHHAPAPTLMVYPGIESAKKASKTRVAPMIAGTPALRERVRAARSRDSGNTTFIKEFDGGVLMLTWATSAQGLKSMPIQYLLLDEADEYPTDVDGQGDPVALARKRTTNFPGRKEVEVSSPTIRGHSRIENSYLASDQRRYFVPCPICGHRDWIRWENLIWEDDTPATVRLRCTNPACGELLDEGWKTQMLARGEWRATAVGDGVTAGYHLSALYSPEGWYSWETAVREFLAAQRDPSLLRNFVNTVLAETYEERGEGAVDPEDLLQEGRQDKPYAAEVPHGVGALTLAVDSHPDRLECLVMGWGRGEELWPITAHTITGDMAKDQPWRALDVFRRLRFRHESGQLMRIERTVIDTQGHNTDQVYRYCSLRRTEGVVGIRGGGDQGREIVGLPSRSNSYKIALFTVGVNAAKEKLFKRLRIRTPGPGFIHIPHWANKEYVKQLVSEAPTTKTKRVRGMLRAVTEWEKVYERNEMWDLHVYNMAALHTLGPVVRKTIHERALKYSQPIEAPKPLEEGEMPPPPAPPAPRRRRRSASWMKRLR